MKVAVVAAFGAALSITIGASSPALAQGKDPDGVIRTHFQCYAATDPRVRDRTVKLVDQFKQDWEQRYGKPILLCNPVLVKDGVPYEDKQTHLVCYAAVEPPQVTGQADVENQFGKSTLTLSGGVRMLCVPSKKAAVRDLRVRVPARR